jgi:hypothetical protein
MCCVALHLPAISCHPHVHFAIHHSVLGLVLSSLFFSFFYCGLLLLLREGLQIIKVNSGSKHTTTSEPHCKKIVNLLFRHLHMVSVAARYGEPIKNYSHVVFNKN